MPRRKRVSYGVVKKYKRGRFNGSTHSKEENSDQEVDTLNEAFCESVNSAEIEMNCSSSTSDVLNNGFLLDNSVEAECLEYVADFDVPTEFDCLKKDLTRQLPSPFSLKSHTEDIQILSFYESEDFSAVKMKIVVDRCFCVKIIVHSKVLPDNHFVWDRLPKTFRRPDDVIRILDVLSGLVVCIGNSDEEFTSMTPVGSLITNKNNPEVMAFHEENFSAIQGNLKYSSTIRSVKCELLVEGVRCHHCSKQRRLLRCKRERLDHLLKRETDFTRSTFKHCDMPRPILLKKLDQQKERIYSLQSKVEKLERDLRKEIRNKGIVVNKASNIELSDLMASCQSEVEKAYPDSSAYQRLFWQQQLKCASGAKHGMRWHPLIIKWCLFIRQKSQKAYDAVRDSGFITLPSNRTLFDYSHYIKSKLGFNQDVLTMLQQEAEKLKLHDENWRNFVGILFDEIKIKEDLVYDKYSGELIGFCSLDNIGNTIMNLENAFLNTECRLAKCVLVLMVRGITSSLLFPLAAFATQSITAGYLYSLIWEAITVLEVHLRLRVLFLTCDGASANRKFHDIHKLPDFDSVHYSFNPYDEERKIYFISDVPHLLKTTRNCFSNSFSHKNTRRLWNRGKDISWLHVLRLYEEHCELNLYTPCPKLTRNHVDLNAFSYMKVSLAAQVLSDSVANALEDLYQDNVSETVLFIRNMNKFFDIMNVRSLVEGRNKRNPNLNPFTSINDERLTWLEEDFLGYLDSWGESVAARPGEISKKDRAGMMLSHQTISGLKMSVKSIVACIRYLLSSGASFILSHGFNQDPLEQHFGHYRYKGGSNSNPTVNEVRHILTNIRTVGAQALPPKAGNIEVQNVLPVIDNTKLPRRR